MVRLGERIKQMRENRGLSLTDLARRCRISKAYLSQLESGHSSRPSAEYSVRICSALGCSIETILGRKDSELGIPNPTGVPFVLRAFAKEENLSAEDVVMLSQISYNGRRPGSVEGWRSILEAIRNSTNSG